MVDLFVKIFRGNAVDLFVEFERELANFRERERERGGDMSHREWQMS